MRSAWAKKNFRRLPDNVIIEDHSGSSACAK